MELTTLPEFLTADADGQIRLKGHRIRLIDVASRYDEGHSAETIVLDHYPTLPLSLVYSAIGFYLRNEACVRSMMTANARALEELASQPQGTPSLDELRRRMASLRRTEAP